MIGGVVEVVTTAGLVARRASTERHVFAGALVQARFPFVCCQLCNARLVRDGQAMRLEVGGWSRMVDMRGMG